MNICSSGHEEIVYEGDRWSKCPICELIEEHENEIQSTVDVLKERIEKLEEQKTEYYELLKEHNPELII